MFRPELNDFLRLASTVTLVPVAKSVSADLLTPVSAFLAVAETEPHAFLLESVEGGEKIGRYTFLGTRPYMRLVAGRDGIWAERGRKRQRVGHDPIQALRQELKQHVPALVPGLPPFTGGAVGYFAYDFVRRLEKLPLQTRDDLNVPDCLLMFFDRLLAFDHVRHQIHIIAIADVGSEPPRRAYERAQRDINALERKLTAGLKRRPLSPVRPRNAPALRPHVNTTREKFIAAVQRAKEYIAAGDIFQVVLSQRFEFDLRADAFAIYRALRTVNPSPYMYFLRMGKLTVLGSSPEMLVRASAGRLDYRPIAGTQPRGATDEEDQQLEQRLRTDEKERAEHVMLVDLGRNDIGRVSEYGSVKVKDLMYVERYSHVMHLVSAIEGKLRPDLDALDAFAACFPAGTLSGAPKVRAMEIIEELEPTRRGLYGGSVLYADFAGNLDSCIAIRSMLVKDKKAYVQAGAGIVADSVPEREYEECMNKAKAVMRAAEMARG
jgi:anthranilate synthase component 1